jgi:hypothetical protein
MRRRFEAVLADYEEGLGSLDSGVVRATAAAAATVFSGRCGVSGKAFDRTAVTSSLIEYLRPPDVSNENLVDQTGIEPVTS